jgi:hypothetical protein
MPSPAEAGSLCAGHAQQLGSESLLPNLMEVKGWQVQPKLFQPTRQDDHCFSDCTVFVIQILDDADVVFRISDAEFADVLRFYPRPPCSQASRTASTGELSRSDLVPWHEADQSGRSRDVRC